MTRRWRAVLPLLGVLPLLAVLGVLVPPLPAVAQPTQAARPAQAAQTGPDVVVVGVTGLRWSHVGPATPTLAALAENGAVGVLSVKAVPTVTCSADGWLTLGAGARARAFPEDPQAAQEGVTAEGAGACEPVPLADAAEQRQLNEQTLDSARVGALGELLGERVTAYGPGARRALGLPPLRAVPPPPERRPGLLLVDLGELPVDSGPAELRQLDALLADALRGLPARTDVLVVGVAAPQQDDTPDLAVAIAAGPSYPAGALWSASTRRPPYVQLVDVAPTVLSLLGAPVPPVMDGAPWQVVAGAGLTLEELTDLQDRAATARRVTVPFFVVLVAGALGLLVALRHRPRALRLAALSCTAAVGMSYVAQLVPWERSPAPLLTLLAVVAGLSVAVAHAARSVGRVCGLVALVLVVDLLAGAPLQMDAVAGYSPLVAGRFAGLGNVAFGVYGSAALLATSFAATGRPRRSAALLVAGLGAVAVVVAGAPPWGSDVGGVLALVPAFVLLGLRVTGARVTAGRLALAAVAGAVVVTAFALLDLARPEADRSHLGRFAADVRDGTAGELLVRKAASVVGLLLANPVTALLPVLVAAAVWVLLHPRPPLQRALDREPALRTGLLAVGVMSAVGFLVNDSGAAVPALALLVAAPATVAVVAREAGAPASVD